MDDVRPKIIRPETTRKDEDPPKKKWEKGKRETMFASKQKKEMYPPGGRG